MNCCFHDFLCNIWVIVLVIVGLFVGMNGFAQDKKGPEIGKTASNPAEGERINAFMVEKIVGSRVINVKGETLGKIEDLVVDIDTGRILYAVLDSGGFLGIGSKLFPVPWESLAALPSEGIFFLNQSKEQMEKAPAFDKKNLPDVGDMRWGGGILKHYGVPGYEKDQWGWVTVMVMVVMVMVVMVMVVITGDILVQGEKTPIKKSLTLKQSKPSQGK